MNDLRNIDSDLPTLSDENLTNILLLYDNKTNQIVFFIIIIIIIIIITIIIIISKYFCKTSSYI